MMTGRNRPWTEEETMVVRNNPRLPIKEIAAMIGRAVSTVKRHRKKLGLTRCYDKDLHEKEFLKHYQQGLSDYVIGLRMRMSKSRVSGYRTALGLPPHGYTKLSRTMIGDNSRKTQNRLRADRRRSDKGMAELEGGMGKAKAILMVYDSDQAEFLRSILQFREQHKRVPTLLEGFRIALMLGWRKE